MNRLIIKSQVGGDGVLHLDLPLGLEDANREVQVTVEPVHAKIMTAADLLQSGLVGIWADRDDLGDSKDFARRLREQAQRRTRP
jgi:hypothetical protein